MQCAFIADVAPNVVFDTASCATIGPMIQLVRQIGAHRILFGSQYYSSARAYGQNPLVRPGKIVARSIIDTPDLTTEEKALILGGNARRILEL
ncbi:MAG TPA: amidohydrolase family protein [Sphingobium sp.]|nr:amidohydrolase family protein [Sphingobium sp.]